MAIATAKIKPAEIESIEMELTVPEARLIAALMGGLSGLDTEGIYRDACDRIHCALASVGIRTKSTDLLLTKPVLKG